MKTGGNTLDSESTLLVEELEHFRQEKEKIRNLVGQIGGKASSKRDMIINIVFVIAIASIFALDILRHALNIPVPLTALFSIELGVLLVSIKIVWMIYKQGKVEHFQFWILNSIEFRLNDVAKRLHKIEAKLQ